MADHPDEDWLAEPILPRGRAVVTYSIPKAGKSLLALDLSVRLATGQRCLDQTPGPPLRVVYLDFEMGEADLRDRLVGMDYGPHTDLTRLAYYVLPDLDGLDTPKGGKAVRAIVDRHDPHLVVIDTITAAVVGNENDSDTFRNYWRHTGRPLKDREVTVWRLDHSGKDTTKGQRGSSAKAGDIDLVWELVETVPGQLRMRATHRRVTWVPQTVELVRLDMPTRHEVSAGRGWPPGTYDTATECDRHGLAVDVSVRAAAKILRANGWSGRQEILAAALRWRRQNIATPGGKHDLQKPMSGTGINRVPIKGDTGLVSPVSEPETGDEQWPQDDGRW